MLEYSRNLKQPARELRKNMTDAERLLWSRLRRKQLLEKGRVRKAVQELFTVEEGG